MKPTSEQFDPQLLEEVRSWDPKSQAEVASRLEQLTRTDIRHWYCDRGRRCDGKPHERYPYPHARGDQWPPRGVNWFLWFIMSGRGAGKTRAGSEFTRKMTEKVERLALIARRGTDLRATMIEGQSGLIKVCERAGMAYTWYPSKKEFHFGNGAIAYGYSGEEPDSLRGPEHGYAWLDEPAHMPLINEVWDMLLMGLRADGAPGGAKVVATTTPVATKWVKERAKEEGTIITRVSTYENLDNLDPNFRRNILKKYEGTRLGKQELHGEILQDVEGALWNWDMIEGRREQVLRIEDMQRIVIGVDPSGTASKQRDETGIVAVGQVGDHYYVLADRSGHYTPHGWASATWQLYDELRADKVVAEKNYGGEMVRSTLLSVRASQTVELVNSRRGKALRAQPIVSIYEQGRFHHLGTFADMEEQQTEWVPGLGDSPDRVDALVHAGTDLTDHEPGEMHISTPGADLILPPNLSQGVTDMRRIYGRPSDAA